MHEAALAEPLLRLILDEARRNEAPGQSLRVTSVRLCAGLLVGIEASTLIGCFSIMAEGTSAEHAALSVSILPMQGTCPNCGAVQTVRRAFNCPLCHGHQVNWQGGNEMYVEAITVENL